MKADVETRIVITYCRQCNWLLRSAWYAQELLNTFSEELTEVALAPSTGGVFSIHAGEQLIWDRKLHGGFPEIQRLKQLVRDQIAPDKSLGHSESGHRNKSRNDLRQIDTTES